MADNQPFVENVELQGHIIDSLILPKVLDEILTRGGTYVLKDIQIGRRQADPSHVVMEVRAATAEQLQDILDQALRWHATSVNIKSTAIPAEWKPAFREFQKKIGYRYILRRLECPETVRAGAMIPVSMWWLNAGVAPVYGDYWLGVRIDNHIIRIPVDIRKWLPGDAVFDGTIFVPATVKPGTHRLQVAILSDRTGQAAIRLAIEGRQPDGWYDVGTIEIASAR